MLGNQGDLGGRTQSGGSGGPRVPPILRIEGYEVLRELHHGGQGVVFEAIQRSTKRKVAVKVLLDGADAPPVALKRFEREIELAAQLKHPNIITVFDSGVSEDGRRYYVMDYVRGEPISRFVREQKLVLEDTLKLFALVCDAVQYAHQRGVIHRDLKPSNVLVEAGGAPKVLDFGLAKQLSAPLETVISLTGQLVGTIPFMSPEQVRGKTEEVDARSDVYSLGVMLYQLLTGQYPYPVTGDLGEVLQHIKESAPTPPSRNWSAQSGIRGRHSGRFRSGHCPIDRDLQAIVLQALAKERDRRYQSAGLLSLDIGRYLAGEPIAAKRDSLAYVVRKKLRRKRQALTVTVVVTVALAVGGYFFLESQRQARLVHDQRAALLFAECKQESDTDLALSKCDEAIRLRTPFLDAELYRAFLLKRVARTEGADGAIERAESILARFPECAPAHLLLAQIFEGQDPRKAKSHMERARQLNLEDESYQALAIPDDKAAEAIAMLEKIVDRNSRNLDARQALAWRFLFIRDYEKALRQGKEMEVIDRRSASAFNIQGLALSRMEQYEEAIKAYDAALSLQPAYPPSLLNRSDALVVLGRLDEAEADCQQAIALEPHLPRGYTSCAWVAFQRKPRNLALAEKYCHDALRLNPEWADAHEYLAMAWWWRDQREGALQRMAQAIECKPRRATPYVTRGKWRTALNRHEEAVADFSKALELGGDNSQVLIYRGRAFRALMKWSEAIRDFNLALSRDPQNEEALVALGLTLREMGDSGGAIREFDRLIQAHAESVLGYVNRGETWLRQTEYSRALQDFEQAVELKPNVAEIRRGRAAARWLCGDLSGALADLDSVARDEADPHPVNLLLLRELFIRLDRPGDGACGEYWLGQARKTKASEFHQSIVRFVAGHLNAPALLALVKGGDTEQFCEAHYFIGVTALLAGNNGAALQHLKECVATNRHDCYEWHLARRHLLKVN